MSDIATFLGEIAARVVRNLIDGGHPGVRLQNVTAFSPEAFLKHLNSDPRPRVAVAGSSARDLARKTRFPEALLTDDLAKATEWRNDNKVTGTVVVIAFGEEERLGSFHRFTEIRDRDLYHEICRLAETTVCPNKVQTDWWSVLSKAEVIRQVSVFRLASYYLFLLSKPRHIPDASRDGLYHLGLLPSREFFEHASPAQLLRNLHLLRQLTNRIEILSNVSVRRNHPWQPC
jgi:hypothetical protein